MTDKIDTPPRGSLLRTLAINGLVFAALLAVIELAAVYRESRLNRAAEASIFFEFAPYTVTTSVPNHTYLRWFNAIFNKLVDVNYKTNNYGFPNGFDFDLAKPQVKQAGHKVVALAGGSTAFGVGASSNRTSISDRLAALLNGAQQDISYDVVNLAGGGWIAQQEAIALDMWGRIFNPDWIVTLDGVNDATVGCAMSQGTGNPVRYQLIRSFVMGYLGRQKAPVFYRGEWENGLIGVSAAYRLVTGKRYVPRDQDFDPAFTGESASLSVVTPTLLSEVRRQVAFYTLAQESILERFQDAKFILATQPTNQDLSFLFGDFYRQGETYTFDAAARDKFAGELDKWLDFYKPETVKCSGDPTIVSVAVRYVEGTGAIRLAELVESYQARKRRDVAYFNTGVLFPRDPARRNEYFIDNYHLNDKGQDYLARFYAHAILKRDFPERDWSAVRPENLWFTP